MTKRICTIVLAITAGLAACSAPQKDALMALRESVEAYNQAYRWKNFERAASYLPSDLRAAFIASYENDEKSLHVEGYRVLRVDYDGGDAATVVVNMRYLLLPSVVIEKRMLTQHWHRIDGTWILETEDNSIREIDLTAVPQNPEAFGGGDVDQKDVMTDIEATDPSGKVIRESKTKMPDPGSTEE